MTTLWINGQRSYFKDMKSSYGEHGDEQLTFTVPWRFIPQAPRCNVSLEHPTYGYYWNGYYAGVTPSLNTAGCAEIVARGMYKTADDGHYYNDQKWKAGIPADQMVTEALTRCPRIQGGSEVGELDFQLVEDTPSFGLQSATNVFDYAKQLTSYRATPLVWQVLQRLTIFEPMSYLEMKAADFAPRYRVKLGNKDEFKPTFDFDIIYNCGITRWGNEQYQLATNNGYSNPQLPQNPLVVPTRPVVRYDVIPDIRDKCMDVSGSVNNIQEVQQLAGYLVNRFNVLRPASATLSIDMSTVIRSVYPAIVTENIPHELVHSNFSIEILNDLREWGIFGITTFYIISAAYDYTTCKLDLQLGYDNILSDSFRLLGSYDVSREYISLKSGVVNLLHHDTDALVQYGTEFNGKTGTDAINTDVTYFPPIVNEQSAGIVQGISSTDSVSGAAKFTDADQQFYQPTGKSIDPNVIPDYGTQANFGREADSTGIKGFIRVIPIKVVNWEIAFLPPPNSDTIPSDSITIEFYDDYPFTPGSPFATKSVSAAQSATGTFTGLQLKTFTNGGKIGIRVSVAAATAGAGFLVGIGGKKLYPDLGIAS